MPTQSPRQQIKSQAKRLSDLYSLGEKELLAAFNKALLDPALLPETKKRVLKIRQELLAGGHEWISSAVPILYLLGLGKTADALHEKEAQILADHAASRLSEVDQFVGRQADDFSRAMSLAELGEEYEDVADGMKKKLADNGILGFKGRDGKSWNLETYASLLAITVARDVYNAGVKRDLKDNNTDLLRIADSPTTCPYCLEWKGQIVSLNGATEGYPTVADAEEGGWNHYNCVHPLEKLSPDELAAIQGSD